MAKKGRTTKSTKGVAKQPNTPRVAAKNQHFVVLNKDLGFLEEVVALTGASQFIEDCMLNAIACCLIIIIMCQIRINTASLGYTQTTVDQLPSYKVYKQRIISGVPGRTISAIIAVADSLKFLSDDVLQQTIEAYTDSPIKPRNPVQNGATTYGEYIPYRMTQVHGTMQSCPASNVKMFGLPNGFEKWGLQEALTFIKSSPVSREQQELILKICDDNMFTNKGGIPQKPVIFAEPSNISSNLEKDIFGDNIVRNGAVESKLGPSGTLPASPITLNMVNTHLSARERVLYNIAQTNGDKVLLRELNAIITKKMSGASKAAKTASKTTPPAEPVSGSADSSISPVVAPVATAKTNRKVVARRNESVLSDSVLTGGATWVETASADSIPTGESGLDGGML